MKVFRDLKGHLINIGEWTSNEPLPDGAYEDEADIVEDDGLWERGMWASRKATQFLHKTDHVHAKAREGGLILHPEWITWRQQMRDTAAGRSTELPPEPQRFLEFAQPVIEEDEDEIPPDIAALMRENDAYSDAAVLLAKYNELTNKIMMTLATDNERAMHTRLHNNLHWLERKAAEIL